MFLWSLSAVFKFETSCPRTWIEEPCRSASHIPSVSEEAARLGIQEITRCLSESIRLMAADSGLIKTELSVVLNHELTDVQSRRSVPSSKVLWTFPHVHRLFLLPKYISRRIEFSATLFERRRRFSPRAVRKLECLTHLCLVSVFLDYSILSGSPFARAPIP